MSRHRDTQLTEALLREAILHIAPQVIYVVAKFDTHAQTYIENLISQINDMGARPITAENKLLVIHNYMTVKTKKDLDDLISVRLTIV